jgi:hypothetical protein
MMTQNTNLAKLPYRLMRVLLMVVFSVGLLRAQEVPQPDSAMKMNSLDTLSKVDTIYGKKRFWRSSGELMLVQVIPWAYNYYVRDADFAHISMESIKHNIQFSNWEWDDNSFKTNQFAHPYHGSLYYSSFRSNGYSFWQSAPAAFAGSYIWEVAGETHPPAPNDFINTSLGGISLGEMTYRLSNHIVHDNQRGFKRQMQEVFAFLVNPMNGFNRILDGRWGRVHIHSTDTVEAPLKGFLDIGVRRFSTEYKDVLTRGDNEFYLRLRLLYGDADQAVKTAFGSFSIIVEAGASDSAYLNRIMVNGVLKQWVLKESDAKKHLASVTMNYDYLLNNSFEYGGQSFHFKLLSDWNKHSRTRLHTTIGLGPVVLAAVPDDYLYYGEGRNYDYGPGISWLGEVGLNLSDRFLWNVNYRGSWFNTLNGNESNFTLNAITNEFRYIFKGSFSTALEVGQLSLNGIYANYDDVLKKYPFGRLSVGWKL